MFWLWHLDGRCTKQRNIQSNPLTHPPFYTDIDISVSNIIRYLCFREWTDYSQSSPSHIGPSDMYISSVELISGGCQSSSIKKDKKLQEDYNGPNFDRWTVLFRLNMENFPYIMSTLFVKVKKIFRQINTIFFLLLPDIPRYVQWTIPNLLDQIRRKNLL